MPSVFKIDDLVRAVLQENLYDHLNCAINILYYIALTGNYCHSKYSD